MSTKNMSRALIEGGHRSDWSNTCQMSTRAERRRWKQHCRRLSMNSTLWLDENDPQDRMPSSWGYTGKRDHSLSWLDRWLSSQVGKSWDEVYSQMCHRFSRRSWRGWQIVSERLSWYVGYESDLDTRWKDFIVGNDGILRRDTDYDFPHMTSARNHCEPPESWPVNEDIYHRVLDDYERLCGNLKSAYFIVVSGQFYWVRVTKWCVECVPDDDGVEAMIYHPEHYALWRKLTNEELEYLQSLDGHDYRELRWRSAVSSRKGQNSWRRYSRREELPELTLESYDKKALSAE